MPNRPPTPAHAMRAAGRCHPSLGHSALGGSSATRPGAAARFPAILDQAGMGRRTSEWAAPQPDGAVDVVTVDADVLQLAVGERQEEFPRPFEVVLRHDPGP